MRLLKTLFNRQWWWATLLVIAGLALLIYLGIWQLDRLEQRQAQNEITRQQLAAPPMQLNQDTLPESANLINRRVSVAGTYDFSQQVVLKLQNWQGRPGFHLLTPLQITGRDEAILVDRGWLPDSETNLSQFDEAGQVTVTGFLQPTQTSSRIQVTPAGPQREWFRIDLETIQAQLPYDILPVYLQQSPPAGDQIRLLPYRADPEFDLSNGPHLSYALQWFSFSLMLGVGYLVYVWRQTNHPAT